MSRFFLLIVAFLAFTTASKSERYRNNKVHKELEKSLNNNNYNRNIDEEFDYNSLSLKSNSDKDKNTISFVIKPLPYGLVLTYKSKINNSLESEESEKTSVIFKRLFTFVPEQTNNTNYNNETKYNIIELNNNNFGHLTCVTQNMYKTCNISTLNNVFSINIDYSSQVFQKGIKYVFPTDVKVTVIINMPFIPTNHIIGLVTSFKTNYGNPEIHDDEVYIDDKRVSTGNLTYFSFETIAINKENETINVTMSNMSRDNHLDIHDDNDDENNNEYEDFRIFTFTSNSNLSYILWDPMIGSITSSNSQTSTSSNFLSGGQIAGIVVGSVFGILIITGLGLLINKKLNIISA